jgi:hypothetical protein
MKKTGGFPVSPNWLSISSQTACRTSVTSFDFRMRERLKSRTGSPIFLRGQDLAMSDAKGDTDTKTARDLKRKVVEAAGSNWTKEARAAITGTSMDGKTKARASIFSAAAAPPNAASGSAAAAAPSTCLVCRAWNTPVCDECTTDCASPRTSPPAASRSIGITASTSTEDVDQTQTNSATVNDELGGYIHRLRNSMHDRYDAQVLLQVASTMRATWKDGQ